MIFQGLVEGWKSPVNFISYHKKHACKNLEIILVGHDIIISTNLPAYSLLGGIRWKLKLPNTNTAIW